jgi:CHAT domain-containing protein
MRKTLHLLLILLSLNLFAEEQWVIEYKLINKQAWELSNQGDYKAAISACTQAIDYVLEHGGESSKYYMEALLSQGNNYYYQRDLDSALYFYKFADEMGKKHLDPEAPLFSKTTNNIANILSARGQYDEALSYYLEAAKNKEKNMDPFAISLAKTYNNIGDMYLRKMHMDSAFTYYQRTDSVLDGRDQIIKDNGMGIRTQNSNLVRAILFNSLNEYYYRLNDFEASHEYTYKSYQLLSSMFGESHSYVLQSINNVGISFKDLGNEEKALSYMHKALDLRLKKYNKPNKHHISSYASLGNAYLRFGKDSLAAYYYQKGLAIAPEVNDAKQTLLADIAIGLAKIQSKKGELAEVNILLHEACEHTKSVYGDEHIKIAEIAVVKAEAFINGHSYVEAMEAIEKGLLIIDNSKTYSLFPSITKTKLLNLKTKLFHAQKDYKYAAETAKLFSESAQQLLDLYLTEESSLELRALEDENMQVAISSLYLLWENTADQNYIKEAFSLLSTHKNSLLRKGLSTNDILSKEEKELKLAIGYFYEQLSKLKEDEPADDLLANLAEKRHRLQQVSSTEKVAPQTNWELSDIAASLPQEASLIEYFFADSSLYTLILHQGQMQMNKTLAQDIAIKVAFLNKSIQENDFNTYCQQAYDLYQELTSHSPWPSEQAYLVPHKELWNLSFDALLTQSVENDQEDYRLPYLIKEKTISYLPYSSILLEERERKGDLQSYLGVAPVRFLSQEELTHSAKEITNILQKTDGELLMEKEANKVNFLNKAPNFQVIHLATHAEVNNEHPLLSHISFATDSLKAYEIYPLSLPAEVAILSACQTAEGSLHSGEGQHSLGRAFHFAGVKTVLMSLWKTSDFSSSIIISDFINRLFLHENAALALSAAKRAYLDEADAITSNPAYWSGYVISGSPKPLRKDSPWQLILGISALAAVFFLVLKKRA